MGSAYVKPYPGMTERERVERQISPLVEQPKNENFKTLQERALEANREKK